MATIFDYFGSDIQICADVLDGIVSKIETDAAASLKRCRGCHKWLPSDQFDVHASTAKKKRTPNKTCRVCCSTRNARRAADPRRAVLRKLLDAFQARPCVDCGGNEYIEADHLPWLSKKVKAVSEFKFWVCHGVDAYKAELNKCDPRCVMCHRIVSHLRGLKTKVHRELLGQYSQSPKAVRERKAKARNDKYNRKRKREAGGCAICGLACRAGEESAFDWDHIDRSTKRKTVSGLVCRTYSIKTIRKEINEKCRLLCAVCHRGHTKVQFEIEI
jgi:hypothetical protein